MFTLSQVNVTKRRGNLHIRLAGPFGPKAGEDLVRSLCENARGEGRIFIDLRALEPLQPVQQSLFRECLDKAALKPERVYFKGEQGLRLAENASRVLIVTKSCRCGGACPQRQST